MISSTRKVFMMPTKPDTVSLIWSPLSMKSGKRLTSGKGKDDASKDFALLCLGGVNP